VPVVRAHEPSVAKFREWLLGEAEAFRAELAGRARAA
jgi:hypothetical protein